MKLIHTITIAMGLALGWLSASAQTQNQTQFFLHTVTKGQSLYSISRMYNVNRDDILRLNPGCDKQIRIGEALKIPQGTKDKATSVSFHTIQGGETLYQLSVKYNLTVQAICEANPGLSVSNFKMGQVIAIPAQSERNMRKQAEVEAQPQQKKQEWKEMHKVKRRETIFSICKEYSITQQELIDANPELKNNKLKKGSFLFIPYSKAEQQQKQPNIIEKIPTNEELFSQNEEQHKAIKQIKAAVMLPFMTQASTSKDEQLRMVEYYEGMLIAIDSLKRQGVSIDLYTYDTKNSVTELKKLLDQPEMKSMDVIFGPVSKQNIQPLADYTKQHNIRLVVPFAPKVDQVFNTPNIYQINTPQSYLYSEVYDHFVRKFEHHKIIFVQTDQYENEKEEFINGMKIELANRKMDYREIKLAQMTNLDQIIAKMDTLGNNIFVPTSGKNTSLIKLLPKLTQIKREHPHFDMHLFGYPEWQTYTQDHLASFYELDTYFYSSFYTNNLFPAAIHFTQNYRRWYSKDMANIYPKYGMLGFDTAYFFLKGLAQHGNQLDEKIDQVKVTAIQTGFKFERVNNWGGFINKKVFFVHFTPNYELIKIDFE